MQNSFKPTNNIMRCCLSGVAAIAEADDVEDADVEVGGGL